MQQETIRQLREAIVGVVVGIGAGLFAEVTAGHYQNFWETFSGLQHK